MGSTIFENELNLKATELRLGLPGRDESEQQQSSISSNNKRSSSEMCSSCPKDEHQDYVNPPPKVQVVGWPPVRSYRKNVLQPQKKPESDGSGGGMLVKVSMDGAPYLRKIDLNMYRNYFDLLKELENMFKCSINGSDYSLTYEDKDGDWMLVGDVPWDMFITYCKRLRIMRASEAKGNLVR